MKLWKVTLYESKHDYIIVDGKTYDEALKNAEEKSKCMAFSACEILPNEELSDEDMMELCKVSKMILNHQKSVNKFDFIASVIDENLDAIDEVLTNMDIIDKANAKLNEISRDISKRLSSVKIHNKNLFVNDPILDNKTNIA